MVMTWFIGMYGLTSGAETVAFLRQGTVPAAQTEAFDNARESVQVTHLRAIADARKRTFPLAVAQALLSLLLVVGSVATLAGRRGARSLVTQALVANGALGIVGYALTLSVRGATIAQMTRAIPEFLAATHVDPWWLQRSLVFLELSALILALLAVHAKRSRAYFDSGIRVAEARASDHDEEP